MAEKFSPAPDEAEETEADEGMQTIVGNLGAGRDKKLVGLDLYRVLMEDEPMKLNEEQVGFRRGGGSEEGACGGCVHHYIGEQAKRKVCEIFRPSDDSDVERDDVCRFVSADGVNFPFIKKAG